MAIKNTFMKKSARKEARTGYLMIAPLMIGLLIFSVRSFFVNFYYSFTNKSAFGNPKFIGLANYEKLFHSDKFYAALGNTFLYVLLCVPFVIAISLLLAVLLNKGINLTGFYRTLIFIPAVTMPAAIGLIWKWILNYEFGLLNAIIRILGGQPQAWLSDPNYVLLSVSAVLIWADVSLRMIVFLAGLQNIPKSLYEAAEIDGANNRTKFFKITLPMLSPTIFFVTLMEIIGVFQIFDFIYLMIPMNSSGMPAARSLVSYFYEEAFVRNNRGYGSAITVILFIIIFIITMIQMKLQKKWVFTES
ncbi:MAG TPA: sugar ABC transporter permease [Flexilinea sp.]|jgi:multiple sugar transport system permease protein|nr:sugar ABC transporter permease [Flexilinea sp.]HOG59991.1 sugar ABC transporter permease [Flexilinea sp.]HPJ64387.1 sugar ABC transporter permease [Flexilinea sp.]HPL58435.1 sugar ABC transporter permease [Flexilinea sp.]HPR71400.1 sugar ABC transporter permease [Flexilinea sp.]